MKSSKLLLFGLAVFSTFAVAQADATTVNWGAVADNGLADASGTALLAGDLLLIGSFNIPDSTIQANSGNVAFLMSHFAAFGSSTIGNDVNGMPAYFFQNTVNSSDATTPFPVSGNQIYIWAFNTGSSATATQQGIFSLNSTANWLFPHDNDIVTTTSIDLTDLTQPNSTTLSPQADIVVGNFRQGAGNAENFNLAVIPEPSTYALGLFGGVGLLIAVRRRA